MSHEVHIYTDGAAKGNPGPAGYGVVMEMVGTPYKKEFYEGFRLSTNNRMELLAVIVGLEKLKNPKTKVLVVSDSKYVVDSVEKRWVFQWEKINFKAKKNPDLWMRFLKIYRQHQMQPIFRFACISRVLKRVLLKANLQKLQGEKPLTLRIQKVG